jgi:hyperosmotically inducible protein
MKRMHVHRRRAAVVLLAALLGSTAMVGCSSTPTQQSAGQAVDDGVVTAKVKAALVADPVTKAHQINVETFKGTVQLSGFVETDEARSRALQLARDVEGVRRVQKARFASV